MIVMDVDVDGLQCLGTVGWNSSDKKDREGYYVWDKILKFPSKNLQKLTEFLIRTHTREGEIIFDPMSGIGTTCVESLRNNRRFLGCELYQKNVDKIKENISLWYEGDPKRYKIVKGDCLEVIKRVPDEFVHHVLFSPPYGKQNHCMGKGEKQKLLQANKSMYSCVDYGDNEEDMAKDFAKVKSMKEFQEKMFLLLSDCARITKVNGYCFIILQDYIRKGKPVGLVKKHIEELDKLANMSRVGYYARTLNMTGFKQMQLAKGNNVIGVEHTLVYRRV